MLDEDRLEVLLETLSRDGYCADANAETRKLLGMLLPPERVATIDCAAEHRYFRNPEGVGKRRYLVARTPYMRGPQDSLDRSDKRMTVVVGPERCGKSVGGENHLFKRLRNGPLTDTIIYLQADTDVDSYADKEFKDFFDADLHSEIAAQIGPKPSDNKRELKRVAGKTVQLLPANDNNLRQKEAPFIIATEIDGWRKSVRSKAVQEIRGRQKSFGNQAKAYVESHADLGMDGPIVTAWKDSTRGVPFWPCAECGDWSSPHPQIAPKGMVMELVYTRDDSLGDRERLAKVDKTARLACPHCGSLLDDAQRDEMADQVAWVFEGETIARDGTVTGEPIEHDVDGFWIHGTMSKIVRLGAIAREYVAALVYFERTRNPIPLRRAIVKTKGEAYEGSGGRPITEKALEEAAERGFARGTVPDGVHFITAAVDIGHSKFDVGFWGWDLEGRSWLIDRITIKQVTGKDGILRDIRPPERLGDWSVLREQVIERRFPLARDEELVMPVAVTCIDVGDGHVTAKGRQFAQACADLEWAGRKSRFPRVKLIRGATSKDAPEVPIRPTPVEKDEHGNQPDPPVFEWKLGVFELKTVVLETLAVDDDGPGQCYYARGLPQSAFAEYVGERLIDGEFVRTGPNETLDLHAYARAGRLILKPDRPEINWAVPPIWARAVQLPPPATEQGTADVSAPAKPKRKNILERFDALNNR